MQPRVRQYGREAFGDLGGVRLVTAAPDDQRGRPYLGQRRDVADGHLFGQVRQACAEAVAHELVEPLPDVRPRGGGVADLGRGLLGDRVRDSRRVAGLYRLQQRFEAFPRGGGPDLVEHGR